LVEESNGIACGFIARGNKQVRIMRLRKQQVLEEEASNISGRGTSMAVEAFENSGLLF
jgi:hypothetical protein